MMSEESTVQKELGQIKEFPGLVIKIHGNGYEGTVDANVAAAIVEVQNRIYRFAAFVKYGDERETRRLSREVRQDLLLQFRVDKGCTEILANVVPAFVEIVKPVFENMTPEQLIELAKYLGTLFAAYKISALTVNAVKDRVLGKDRNEHEEKMLKDQAEAILKSGQQAADAVARALPKAKGLSFGQKKFAEAELDALRERAPREKPTSKQAQKTYIVERIDLRKRPVIYLDLKEVPADIAVKAQYTESEDDAFYDDGTTTALCNAAASGEEIQLDVVEVKAADGSLMRVSVISI